MTTPLFSTYSQGENRVTATFIAVLQRLSLPIMDRILGELLGDQEENFNLVTFVNQPQGIGSRPDAKIDTGHGVWFETKIKPNEVRLDQTRRHMKAVGTDEKLVVLTPDDEKPAVLDSPGLREDYGNRITWASFNTLDDVMKDVLEDKQTTPSEFESYLLREFSAFLQEEGLITIPSEDRVIVVTAGFAWPRYNDRSIYGDIRRPNWKPSAHLAFYTQGEIKPIVPRIKSTVSPLNIMNQEEVKALENYQKKVVRELIDNAVKNEDFNHSLRMLFLTGPEDNDTVRLEGGPIVNDKTSDKTGKRVPLMYGGVRYVTLESLKNARYTSDLVHC